MPLYPAIKLMDTVMGVDTGGGDPIRYEFDGDETLILNLYKQDDGQTFDDLAVDPTNPNTGHTPEWSNLRSGDPGLPAVQTDDGDSAAAVHTPGALLFSFDREPTAQEVVSGEVFYKPPAQTDDGLLLPAVQAGDTDALGDPVTFTYTVRNTSSAYEGTHALYQDVVIPSVDTGPALAIEEITIAHEGIWL